MKKLFFLLPLACLITFCGNSAEINWNSIRLFKKEVADSYGSDETIVAVTKEGVLSVTLVNSFCNERPALFKQKVALEIGQNAIKMLDSTLTKRGVVNFQIKKTDGKNYETNSIAYNMNLDSLKKEIGNKK